MAPKKQAPSGISPVLCFVLVITAFFAGRFVTLPGELPQATGSGPTVVGEETASAPVERRSTLEAVVDGAVNGDGGAAQAESVPPVLSEMKFESAEEVLEASGFLDDRPPQPHGESGHSFYTVQPMQLLSLYPRAYLMPRFLSKEKCDHVIAMATARLAPSGLAFKSGDTADNTRDIRTSSGTFMARDEDPEGVLAYIEDKIAAVTMIPAGHGEPFNVLRYEPSQHYDSHYDSFNEEEYGPQFSQRIATVLLYLADVEEGGETVFLLEGKDGLGRLSTIDYKACDTGIKVKPRQGDALLFYSVSVNGTVDKHSLHGGCPVGAGPPKWCMTKWIRNKCFGRGC